jgi:hypothetical protein
MKIRILPEAEHDLEIGADFYESQRERLGRYFNDCLLTDIDSLSLYAGVHERQFGLHRCMSKRFPFAIYTELTTTWSKCLRYSIVVKTPTRSKLDSKMPEQSDQPELAIRRFSGGWSFWRTLGYRRR